MAHGKTLKLRQIMQHPQFTPAEAWKEHKESSWRRWMTPGKPRPGITYRSTRRPLEKLARRIKERSGLNDQLV